MDVDIKVSELLDKFVFVPREKESKSSVKKILATSNPNVHFNSSAEGIWISSNDVSKLNIDGTGLVFNWTELSEKYFQNRKKVSNNFQQIIDELNQIKKGGEKIAKKQLRKVEGLQVLDSHQWVNVACMTIPNSFGLCVFDEQGAGKTVTLIHAFDVLVERDEIDFALIIAPKSMVSEWPVDFKRFMSDRYKVDTLTGSYQEKKRRLANRVDVIVTNFETVVSMEQEIRALLRKYNSRSTLVVDESFFAKNLDAKRTQAIRRLREYCKRAFVLCGTPAPNSPIDLVQQFNIVDLGFTFSETVIPKDKGEAAAIVQQVIEERGPFVRHLKADILLDLPAKKFNRITVDMQPKQAQLYDEISGQLINDLETTDNITFEKNKMSFFAKRSALLQLCSNPSSVDDNYNETPAKLLAIDKILEDLITNKNEKVILWSFYTASLEAMTARYQKYNPVRYDGTVNDTADRREAVRRFREDNTTMLFIANPAAAGAGLNLQSARYAVYESMSNQAAHYLQSLDRIHRRGQINQVEYLILLCNGTIEVTEYNRLIEKEKSAQKILGDPESTHLTRETMLAELTFASHK